MCDHFDFDFDEIFQIEDQDEFKDENQPKEGYDSDDETWKWESLENNYSNYYGDISIKEYEGLFDKNLDLKRDDNANEFKGVDKMIPKNTDNHDNFEKSIQESQSSFIKISTPEDNQSLHSNSNSLECQNNYLTKTKKRKSQNTPEVDILKRKSPYYKINHENCVINKGFSNPTREFIKELGRNYNIDFHDEIKAKILPKFERIHYRNKGVGIWFFEDLLLRNHQIVLQWLVEKHNLHI